MSQAEGKKIVGGFKKHDLCFFVRGYSDDVNLDHPKRVGIVDAKGGKEAGVRYRGALEGQAIGTVIAPVGVQLRRGHNSSLLAAMQQMQQMQASLQQMVREMRHSTDSIATASGEIAAGNRDRSQRNESQASSLQQTAASMMEELTATVRQNADNAGQASQLASNASDIAQQGGTVVNQVLDTMNSVSDSSRRIDDIIGVAEISAARQEQTAGIEQVNQAISHMDNATQQNAALLEQASAAATSLRRQSGQRVQAVSRFA